jgi:hypothetical protein
MSFDRLSLVDKLRDLVLDRQLDVGAEVASGEFLVDAFDDLERLLVDLFAICGCDGRQTSLWYCCTSRAITRHPRDPSRRLEHVAHTGCCA